MSDNLKTLEQDRDRKVQRAQELHAEWQTACVEASKARDAYLKAQGRETLLDMERFNASGDTQYSPLPFTECELANIEAMAEIEKPEYSAGWWLKKLIGDYRSNGGYPEGISFSIFNSPFTHIELCRLAADLVALIAEQDKANIEALREIANYRQKNRTAGISEEDAHFLTTLLGETYEHGSEQEKHSKILTKMSKWPIELSFQEGCNIMRRRALLEFEQRSAGGGSEPSPIKDRILKKFSTEKWKNREEFIRSLHKLAWEDLPSDSTIRGWLPIKKTTKK